MARPRIFVSSTYYDLRHVRNSLEAFIESFGYDPVLFESGDIPFQPDLRIDESCYSEIQNCHILVLIVGGRYGSAASTENKKRVDSAEADKHYAFYNSITKKEYETARNRPIPIFIFVEKGVLAEYQTFKNNKENLGIKYAHVENVNVFRLLEDIIAQPNNNFVRGFEVFDDISTWLRDQWAGLFADYLVKRQADTTLKGMAAQMAELNSVVRTLKEYSESVIRKVAPDESEKIISTQHRRLVNSHVVRFSREPMIDYIKSQYAKDVPNTRIFRCFMTATDVRDFLSKITLKPPAVEEFMMKNGPIAESDFAEIKKRYSADEAEG